MFVVTFKKLFSQESNFYALKAFFSEWYTAQDFKTENLIKCYTNLSLRSQKVSLFSNYFIILDKVTEVTVILANKHVAMSFVNTQFFCKYLNRSYNQGKTWPHVCLPK